MDYLFSSILFVHVLSALGIIGLVLMQHGKGADMGTSFGSGASGSVFGATGSANFLSRSTAVLTVIFFVASLSLGYIASNRAKVSGSVVQESVQTSPTPEAPKDQNEVPK